MKLFPADLPLAAKAAFLRSAAKPEEIEGLRQIGAAAEIEAVAIVGNANAVIYTTRDGGQSFEIQRIAETIHLKGEPSRD